MIIWWWLSLCNWNVAGCSFFFLIEYERLFTLISAFAVSPETSWWHFQGIIGFAGEEVVYCRGVVNWWEKKKRVYSVVDILQLSLKSEVGMMLYCIHYVLCWRGVFFGCIIDLIEVSFLSHSLKFPMKVQHWGSTWKAHGNMNQFIYASY